MQGIVSKVFGTHIPCSIFLARLPPLTTTHIPEGGAAGSIFTLHTLQNLLAMLADLMAPLIQAGVSRVQVDDSF